MTVDITEQQDSFNKLIVKWLEYMQKLFPDIKDLETYQNLVEYCKENAPSRPVYEFLKANQKLQGLIRARDDKYFAKENFCDSKLDLDVQDRFKTLPDIEKGRIWFYLNSLLSVCFRIFPQFEETVDCQK